MRALIAASLLLPVSVFAQATVNVPQVMGYQGRLVKADGGPVTGTAENPRQVNIIFRIYDQDVGGALKWTEKQTVLLTNGFYAVFLGSQEQFPPGLFDGNLRWLELQIEGDSMALTPRQQIASVAYAFRSMHAVSSDTATTAATATNVSGTGTVNAGTGRFTGEVRAASFTGPLNGNASSASTATNVSGTGTVNAKGATFTEDVRARSFVGPLSGKASSAGYADSAGSAATVPGRVVGGCIINMNGTSTALQGPGCDCWNADCSTVSCSSAGCTDPSCPAGSERRMIGAGNCYCGGQGYCRNFLCIQR